MHKNRLTAVRPSSHTCTVCSPRPWPYKHQAEACTNTAVHPSSHTCTVCGLKPWPEILRRICACTQCGSVSRPRARQRRTAYAQCNNLPCATCVRALGVAVCPGHGQGSVVRRTHNATTCLVPHACMHTVWWCPQAMGKAVSYGIRDQRSIREQRESLPIFHLKEQLMQAVADNQVRTRPVHTPSRLSAWAGEASHLHL